MWLLPIVWGERMEAVNKVRQGCVEMGSINAFFQKDLNVNVNIKNLGCRRNVYETIKTGSAFENTK